MTAVTLETLRADFEAAYEALYDFSEAYTPERRHALTLDEVNDFCTETYRLDTRAYEAFASYKFTRDHGLEAAMLYKLSDGAIDPRGAA
jgi:hypothetical protein